MGSHMMNESCQTSCTRCMTLGRTATHTVTRVGGFVIGEVFKERVHMQNWFEGSTVTLNGIFNISAAM